MIAVSIIISIPDGATELRGVFDPSQTVLDVLETCAHGPNALRTPHYRHSCHHGSCGTCGAIINGKEALMCLTRIADLCEQGSQECRIELKPIHGASSIASLSVAPHPKLAYLPQQASYLRHVIDTSSELFKLDRCIECGLCLSACPVDEPFMGPAALAAMDSERESNPAAGPAMLTLAAGPDGANACRRHIACSRVCPQGVQPARRIQRLVLALQTNRNDQLR